MHNITIYTLNRVESSLKVEKSAKIRYVEQWMCGFHLLSCTNLFTLVEAFGLSFGLFIAWPMSTSASGQYMFLSQFILARGVQLTRVWVCTVRGT